MDKNPRSFRQRLYRFIEQHRSEQDLTTDDEVETFLEEGFDTLYDGSDVDEAVRAMARSWGDEEELNAERVRERMRGEFMGSILCEETRERLIEDPNQTFAAIDPLDPPFPVDPPSPSF